MDHLLFSYLIYLFSILHDFTKNVCEILPLLTAFWKYFQVQLTLMPHFFPVTAVSYLQIPSYALVILYCVEIPTIPKVLWLKTTFCLLANLQIRHGLGGKSLIYLYMISTGTAPLCIHSQVGLFTLVAR